MPIPEAWRQLALTPPPLEVNKEWHVFLSYRSINRRWVLNLYDVLTEFGFKVFMDQYVLQPGDELITELENALSKSQSGILVWSCSTADSNWVRKEYQSLERRATANKRFKFVPIKIENCQLPEFASGRIHIDFSDYPEGPNGGDLIKLIYAISGQEIKSEVVPFADYQDRIFKDMSSTLKAAIQNGNSERIIQLFNEGGLPWETSATLGSTAIDGLIKLKKYDEAIIICDKLLIQFDASLRPKQLKALAHARRGNNNDIDIAQEILAKLYVNNYLDPETLGIYGRTWMDKYDTTGERLFLLNSIKYYTVAFNKSPDDYYTGINAASKNIFYGTEDSIKIGMKIADDVIKIVGTEAIEGDYWKTATIAETLLIQKKYKEAGEMYKSAVLMTLLQRGSHESTYNQAKKLMDAMNCSQAERIFIDEAFAHLNKGS